MEWSLSKVIRIENDLGISPNDLRPFWADSVSGIGEFGVSA
jgi:hypothetical protein